MFARQRGPFRDELACLVGFLDPKVREREMSRGGYPQVVVGNGPMLRHRPTVFSRGRALMTGPSQNAGPAMRSKCLDPLVACGPARPLEITADGKGVIKQAAA